MTRTGLSYEYVNDVIDGSWPEAEQSIMTDPYSAFVYAKEVIKGRWPEVEDKLRTHNAWWKKCTEYFPDAKVAPTASTKPKSKTAKCHKLLHTHKCKGPD